MSLKIDQAGLFLPRWRILAEIALIFAIFFLQGAWPVPDVNEPHYLGKAIHYWNSDWAAGDFFLESKDTHKVFYFTFGWLSLWLRPTALAWIGRLATWWLLAWSWRRLSFAVLPRPGWSIFTAALFAMLMNRCHMAGEWVIGGVEAKGFAYVFVFLALEALVRNHWNRAWLLFGAAAAMHVLVGSWAAVAAGLAWLFLRRDRPRLRSMWPGFLAFFVLMLPGLIPALLLNVSTDAASIRQANQIYVFERLPHHLDLFQIEPGFILRFLLLVVLFFVFSWRVLLKLSAIATNGRGFMNIEPSLNRIGSFVIGSLAIALVGAAINMLAFFDPQLAATWLRYYWFRLADVAVPLGVALLGCWWIAQSWHYRPVISCFLVVLVGLTVLSHFGDLTLQRMPPAVARADRLPYPLAWREACLWAADARHTPPGARFITPRLSQTFKWYAGRAEVATWKDVPQDARQIVEWWTRLQDLYATGSDDPEYRWHDSLNELGLQRIKQLGGKYQADYVITEKTCPPVDLEVAYQNKSYIIYKLRDYRLEISD